MATTMVKAFVKDEENRRIILRALLRLDEACNALTNTTADRGYDLGFADGWHVGALINLRLMSQAAGVNVPALSKALAILLGLLSPADLQTQRQAAIYQEMAKRGQETPAAGDAGGGAPE